jgi:hypothetical protein
MRAGLRDESRRALLKLPCCRREELDRRGYQPPERESVMVRRRQ